MKEREAANKAIEYLIEKKKKPRPERSLPKQHILMENIARTVILELDDIVVERIIGCGGDEMTVGRIKKKYDMSSSMSNRRTRKERAKVKSTFWAKRVPFILVPQLISYVAGTNGLIMNWIILLFLLL